MIARRDDSARCGARVVAVACARASSRRQSVVPPLRRAGTALKAANGGHGAELGELSGLLHAGLVKREPEDLSRKVLDEPEPHALKPPRHKVRHTSARRRRARTHTNTLLTGHSWLRYRALDARGLRTMPRSHRTSATPPAPYSRPPIPTRRCRRSSSVLDA